MRLLVYTDSVYREIDGVVYGEIAFTLFQAALASEMAEVTVVGRLDPAAGPANYALPGHVRFLGVPHYTTLTRISDVLPSLARSMRLFWRALGSADAVWLFGPYLQSLLFALLAIVRSRKVVLGVRQDFPAYVRRRRPSQRWTHVVADLLESAWRLLTRFCAVVVVGPELASHYSHAKRVLPIAVSLVTAADIAAGERAAGRSYDDILTVLSVGRLAEEKNPLLLADVLARLRRGNPRWRMVICGDGPLETALVDRLAELGLSEACELRGHLPLHDGLLELYRRSHVFLHISWTEGFPQVLSEAFASGLPVVATAVGGVAEAVDGAALLIPPGDAAAASAAVEQLASEVDLRHRFVDAGFAYARAHTLEQEINRVAAFIKDA